MLLKRSLKINALGTDEINIALDGERKTRTEEQICLHFPPVNARHGRFILSYISISSSVEFLSLKKMKEKTKHICTADEIIGNSLILRSKEIFCTDTHSTTSTGIWRKNDIF